MKPGAMAKHKGVQYDNCIYASVEFQTASDACHAMELDGTELNGHKLVVSIPSTLSATRTKVVADCPRCT